jgi:hypothetical protein
MSTIIDTRTSLKNKVKQDTEMTSQVIKDMESMRVKSTERVGLMEFRYVKAKEEVLKLKS